MSKLFDSDNIDICLIACNGLTRGAIYLATVFVSSIIKFFLLSKSLLTKSCIASSVVPVNALDTFDKSFLTLSILQNSNVYDCVLSFNIALFLMPVIIIGCPDFTEKS